MNFADIILPLPLKGYFTYIIPQDMIDSVHCGSRVIVPFGKKKFYTGIVVFLHGIKPTLYETKEIFAILDPHPILRHPQLKFWEWISSYYMCSVGEVYKAAIPTGMKLESETIITKNEEFVEDEDDRLKDRELKVLHAFGDNEKLSVQEIEKLTGLKNVLVVVKSLLDKQAVMISEQIKGGYKPKVEICVRLLSARDDQDKLRNMFDELSRSKKQLSLLMSYLELSNFMQKTEIKEVNKKNLLEKSGVSPGVLKALVDKGVMEFYNKEISRIEKSYKAVSPIYPLSENQNRAMNEIVNLYSSKDVVLLHGVTGSGKTEIYIHLIEKVLKQGRQVLFMVPEIALTTQLTERLERVFGDAIAIYHSKFSDNERVEVWNKLLNEQKIKIVLGVRSSVFLPFKDLGLVIVDEEHEATYKQQDPAPRYNGRNAAIVLASLHGAKVLLGTATPCIETYFNAKNDKYGLVELKERHEDIEMPLIRAVDIKELAKKKQMISHFSPLLIERINTALINGEQAILFQNRRGFAPMVECSLCAWVPKCQSCDVSLTYHKSKNQLTCHYCGYTVELPPSCPACGHKSIIAKGFGTEKIEEEIENVFPKASVLRMDFDTTRSKVGYEKIISNFEQQKSNILVGTQMVSKGLDFGNVSVVGILNAGTMMNYPDFRAHERAFQMMTQVAGRAGRKKKRGEVILQTNEPNHRLTLQVINNDFEGMYEDQIKERKMFHYPPFYRLIYIYLKHREYPVVERASQKYTERIREFFGNRVLGPDNPPVGRIQSMFIRKIVVKIEMEASVGKAKEILNKVKDDMMSDSDFKSSTFYYDVDPI
ncbi:MAG: primosomal protein N' [Bacteroidales bacterium]|nr:primosomal protein N' [Bacteroidales bacterium]